MTTFVDIFSLSAFVDMLDYCPMNIPSVKALGALVRDRRRKFGMTQQELAERAGVSRAWLVALEQGKPSAQVDLVLRTLRELGLSLQVEAGGPVSTSHGIDLGALLRVGQKTAPRK